MFKIKMLFEKGFAPTKCSAGLRAGPLFEENSLVNSEE